MGPDLLHASTTSAPSVPRRPPRDEFRAHSVHSTELINFCTLSVECMCRPGLQLHTTRLSQPVTMGVRAHRTGAGPRRVRRPRVRSGRGPHARLALSAPGRPRPRGAARGERQRQWQRAQAVARHYCPKVSARGGALCLRISRGAARRASAQNGARRSKRVSTRVSRLVDTSTVLPMSL